MKKTVITAIFCIILFSCKSVPRLDENTEMNFFTDGFISDHYFQVYAIEKTDLKKNTSIVKQRENSYIKANNILFPKIENEVKKYVRQSYSSSLSESEINKLFEKEIFKAEYSFLLRKGKIYYSYFNEDNSCILVYRIKQHNLKQYLDTVFLERKK